MLQYFYTNFGEIYSGYGREERDFPGYTIVLQGNKRVAYDMLSKSEKTLEKVAEYGWILANRTIVKILNADSVDKSIGHSHLGESWHGDCERKIMFIFGAGASANCAYGSVNLDFHMDSLKPPLGPNLFDRRFGNFYNKYRGVKQSLNYLQDETNRNVEELLQREWRDIHEDSNEEVLSRHLNIQYYVQEVLQAVTNRVITEYDTENLYAKLIYKLQKFYSTNRKYISFNRTAFKKIAFVSFNQDTIIEYFLSDIFKTPLNTLSDYININQGPFCLFKPHGSWNWGWRFPDTSIFKGNTPAWLFENNTNFYKLYYELLGSESEMIDWSTWGIESMVNKYGLGKNTIDKSQIQIIENDDDLNEYFPALLLPYRDKDEFTMPPQHLLTMHNYIGNIETLVIIGWKGNEDAFNRMLLDQGQKIQKVIIADPCPDVVCENLKDLLTRRNITPVLYKDFGHFVSEGLKELE